MKSDKSSKKTSSKNTVKISEQAVAPIETAPVEAKPSNRSAKTTTPATTSHRHSKFSVSSAPGNEQSTPAKASPLVTREEVARLAYHFWEERSYGHGSADHDWHRAETTLGLVS